MDPATTLMLVTVVVAPVAVLACTCLLTCGEDRADEPPETAEQRVARVLAEREALEARAEAAFAAPPVLTPLPYFPYAAARGDAPPEPETTLDCCSICLEQFQQGQLCSEVPKCRHVFHRECLGAWAKSSGSCPLCRAKIVPGSDGVAAADDMV